MGRFSLLIVSIILVVPGLCTLAVFRDGIDKKFMRSTFVPVFLLLGGLLFVLAVIRR
jgi:hypothetical protein